MKRLGNKYFRGCGTALVTPFLPNFKIDEKSLRQLVERQIESGVDFLVPCGTTGESPTLSMEEHISIIKIVVNEARGRVPVVPGTGSNNTVEAVELTEGAKDAGADGCLVVCPYYNKPTERGLISYFNSVANVGLPVIVYNIPGRTSVNIMPKTMARLTEHENIVAIKEATGNLEQMVTDILLCGKDITYLSGDDTLTLPLISVGGDGVISVLSNILPYQVSKMVSEAIKGDWDSARKLYLALFNIFKAMFIETNPIPVKAVMGMMGLLRPVWRSPMTPPSRESETEIRKVLELLKKVEGIPLNIS